MSAFSHLPLGQPIPSSAHAVSCSLPTMADVRGYEEKKPETMRHLTSGYPRFVVHPYLQQLGRAIAEELGIPRHTVWLASSERMAADLVALLGPQIARAHSSVAPGGRGRPVHLVAHPPSAEIGAQAKTFLQNVGGFLSSREAEDHLVRRRLLPHSHPERLFVGNDPASEVRRHLLPMFPGAGASDMILTNNGMNAMYAAFRTVAALQESRGRTAWIQLGWLYLDTIAILRRFTGGPADYIYVPDVFDRARIDRIFAEHGQRLAGIVIEAPTNPLIQMPDVPALHELARRHGVLVIVDPSVNAAANLNVLPFADVVVTSLTKYTASEGDLTAGLAVVNPTGRDAAALRTGINTLAEPLYRRDVSRLAAQVGATSGVLEQINASTPQVAAFLERHPAVKEVFWALHPRSHANYVRVATHPSSVGGMISFSLRGPIEHFYDRLCLPKGPSFGMRTTLLCPFMYLAHYDLVSTPAGRAELQRSGLNPELLRLCVGTEPVEDIIAELELALR